jgi:DNA-binding MarR family transcriptional regulator
VTDEIPPDPGWTPDEAAAVRAARDASVAELLMRSGRLVDVVGRRRASAVLGFELRAVHTQLFPHIDADGTRLSDLARRVGVSKQAVAEVVDELVACGVLVRTGDPTDGRAKRIHFSRDGTGAPGVLRGLATLHALDRELAAALGDDAWAALHAALLRLTEVLETKTTT